jgi:hypothetical protein
MLMSSYLMEVQTENFKQSTTGVSIPHLAHHLFLNKVSLGYSLKHLFIICLLLFLCYNDTVE